MGSRSRTATVAGVLVCGRLLEAAVIGVGMISVLAIVTLRDDGAAFGAR